MADASSGEEELSGNVCETADDPTSFKAAVWKLFGFPRCREMRNQQLTIFDRFNIQSSILVSQMPTLKSICLFQKLSQ